MATRKKNPYGRLSTRKNRPFGLREYAEGKTHTSSRYFADQI